MTEITRVKQKGVDEFKDSPPPSCHLHNKLTGLKGKLMVAISNPLVIAELI